MWTCRTCGAQHEEAPFCFGADAPWRELVDEDEFDRRVQLSADQCIVDEKVFFIRGHIEIPIHATQTEFVWSVWCSLSKESHERCAARWELPERQGDSYFGWLSTDIFGYPETRNLKTNVIIREPGRVPRIQLQASGHPLYAEQRDGITLEAASLKSHELLHAV